MAVRATASFRRLALVALTLATFAALAASTAAAAGPVAVTGAPVSLIASDAPTPCAFAWDGATMFVGEGPAVPNNAAGGLFTLSGGTLTAVPQSPEYVFGLAWHDDELFVSTGPTIEVMSGWNGTAFASVKTIWSSSSPQFNGFNGIAFGPDGRLYAGLQLKEPEYDHTKDPYYLSQAIVSMTAAGKHLRIVARGLRQPFQLYFPPGSPYPYSGIEGADGGPIPPDEIVIAKPGDNFGFPTCTWLVPSRCKGFARPLELLPKHASPMGLSSSGHLLYVALYTGIGDNAAKGTGLNPEVVTIPLHGGAVKPFVTGFGVQIIALAIHDGDLYVGTVNGLIFEVPVPAS